MSKQTINIGTTANDGTGDPLRTAFDKANDNFNEIYTSLGGNSLVSLLNTNGEITRTGANKITFKYNALSNLPDANTYEGMIAYVDAESAVYYATGGEWTKLLTDASDAVSGYTDSLSDVAYSGSLLDLSGGISDGQAGHVLQADGDGTFSFVAISGGGGASAIDDLSDVSISSPSSGEVLKWNGSAWANAADATTGTGTLLGLSDTPASFGTAGQVLAVNSGADGVEFVDASGGGGSSLQSRTTASGTTASLADNASANLDITGFKSYALLSIETDRAARVILYANAASRTSDASRDELTDPLPDAGVIAEVITAGAETVLMSPATIGFNAEATPTTTIYAKVTNKSGSAAAVAVDLTVLQLEA